MARTRSFKETVKARVDADPGFRRALLQEAVETLLAAPPERSEATASERAHRP